MLKLVLFFFAIFYCHYGIQGGTLGHHHHLYNSRRLGDSPNGPQISTSNIPTIKKEPVFKKDSIVGIAHTKVMEFIHSIMPIIEDKYNKLLKSLTPSELKQSKMAKFLEQKMTTVLTNLFGNSSSRRS